MSSFTRNQDSITPVSNKQKQSFRVEPLTGSRSFNDFIDVAWTCNRHDQHWVPPLRVEIKKHLSEKNPYFEHAQWQGWVAYQDDQAVGRITAQIDQLHLDQHADQTGFFGFLEAPDEPEIFAELLGLAENWLAERGMSNVQGPFNFSINHELGILIDGFDSPPYLMMAHTQPYYPAAIEACGYTKAMDLLAYNSENEWDRPRVMKAVCRRVEKRISLRPLDRSKRDDELELMRDIFNDAWSENWNFVPFTKAEFMAIGHEMLQIIPDDFIQIAEVEGQGAAFLTMLPNVNEAIADLNGRLLPFGWLKLLWRLKVRYPSTGRIPLMGVRKQYQNTYFGPAMGFLLIEAVHLPSLNKGINQAELSWMLEDNDGMNSIMKATGTPVSKRYRIYEKTLRPASD